MLVKEIKWCKQLCWRTEIKLDRLRVTDEVSNGFCCKLLSIDISHSFHIVLEMIYYWTIFSSWFQLDAQRYMDIVETFQPDWFQALADSDTDRESSKKRIRKSLDKTLDYLDDCISRKDQSDVGLHNLRFIIVRVLAIILYYECLCEVL